MYSAAMSNPENISFTLNRSISRSPETLQPEDVMRVYHFNSNGLLLSATQIVELRGLHVQGEQRFRPTPVDSALIAMVANDAAFLPTDFEPYPTEEALVEQVTGFLSRRPGTRYETHDELPLIAPTVARILGIASSNPGYGLYL